MVPDNQVIEAYDFKIIFQSLEKAVSEQDDNFVINLKESSANNETISLFREYQESLNESTVTTFTNAF